MDNISDRLIILFYNTLGACFEQVLWLFGPLFLIGYVLHWVSKLRDKALAASVGSRIGMYLTGWIGIPVHEMGHAIFCFIFRHKITEIKFFSLSEDETLGYVKHEYNPKNSYQKIGNFFIGIAPMLFGAIVIYAALGILLPQYLPEELSGSIAKTGWEIFKNFFSANNLNDWRFWIFIYISLAVSCHMKLSTADLKGTSSGLITILCLMFLINLIANAVFNFGLEGLPASHWLVNKMNLILSLFYSIMLYALVLSLIYLAPVYLLFGASKLIRKISSKISRARK
jgi:hypothetical protein